MDVEKDLLIVDEVGVSSQQAGREQTSARPVFSDPERVYCRVADPGQERLRRSEGSGGYSYADAVRDHVVQNSNVARRKSTIGAQRGASFSNITGFRCSRSQGDSPNFLGDRCHLNLQATRSRFYRFFDVIINFNIPFIICGDFNAPGQLKVIEQHLESTIEALGLFQHVNSSTHSHVMDCVFSDHSLVTFDTTLSKPNLQSLFVSVVVIVVLVQMLFNKNSDVFCDILSRGDYEVDDLTSAIITSTTNLLDKHAPFRRLSLRGSNRPKHQL
ncbi:hypothetical protein HELRODRAFT_166844 [Helobdella robusta]|uniref:Endonuclease/exonuclease/phosphatase domain-containing protein n=1 Tax=Helobdella robusta TaxID=6412 RepID=T1EYM1_HELRO|nr:hypothetical protein HELRODRAFT_166844 [Helobdella robusta]ESO11797.1 hypothetical protein HELRODRAFT_166844 [Helobdella robusta]